MLVDTHCHLDVLDDVPGALERMRAGGVERVVTIGVDLASSEWAVRAADQHADVWATVGLHPHDAKDRTDALMARLGELAARSRVIGVGEAGLDYHYDNSPREQQRASFIEQIALAKRSSKALVIHTRDAWDDTFAILDAEGIPERTVFHCWSGSVDEARRAVAMGAVLSFSGTITFRNAQNLRDAVAATPLSNIVVETDAPFLTPHPHRGKRNEPGYVRFVVEEIARVKQIGLAEAIGETGRTAERLFGW